MILNRLATAIREQNWFTVLLEIMIVVIGIYLGLQAGNWNQDREDRRAEIAYLERIRADIDSSIQYAAGIVEFQKRHAGHGALILRAVESCQLDVDEREDFATGIYLAGKLAKAPLVRASIQELLSTGRLTIIRNATLRQDLVELLQNHEERHFFMDDVKLRLSPHVNYIDSVAPIIIDGPIGGGATVSWDRLDADFESLCSDRRFYTAMAATLNYTWDSTASLIAWKARLRGVNEAIDAEISRLGAQDRNQETATPVGP